MILSPSDWSKKSTYDADLVIIGAGAAGIALALELKSYKGRIFLLEAGEAEYSDISQDVYNGICDARQLPSGLIGSRLRFLGGSTNCWAGGCGLLDEIDFQKRDWVENSGWPIASSDLIEYYSKAANFLNIGITALQNPSKYSDLPNFMGFDLKALVFTQKTRFKDIFFNELNVQGNLTVFTGANVSKFNRSSNFENVDSIKIESFDGNSAIIKSKFFVLSCGGIENARLLLNTKHNNQEAIGNSRDLLGRYFTEHPIAPCATYIPIDVNRSFPYDTDIFHRGKGVIAIPFYKLPDFLQRKYKTLNGAVQFQSQENEFSDAEISAWNTYRYFKGYGGVMPSLNDYKKIFLNAFNLIDAYLDRRGLATGRVALRFQIEQEPKASNRLTLIQEKDRLGLRRVKLHYDFGPIERRTVNVLTSYAASCLQKVGLGTLRFDSQLVEKPELLPIDLRGGQHHCGTTRMGETRDTGVVNENLRLFDCVNLYVLGSSVFPTNGWVNPTFTIIALALRLADHLRQIDRS